MKRILETLSDNWPQYILEIVVIIAGILGAFALNSWNEGNINRQLEIDILKQIHTDIEGNRNDVEGDLALLEIGDQSYENILMYLTLDLPYHDSLCFDFDWIMRDQYTKPIRAGYDMLKENGLDLMKNDTLKLRIKNLYENSLSRLERNGAFYPDLSDFFGDFYNKNFVPNKDSTLYKMYVLPQDDTVRLPQIVKLPKFSFVGTIGFHPLDFESLKKDPEFLMLFQRSKQIRRHKSRWYSISKQTMDELLDEIDAELTRLQ